MLRQVRASRSHAKRAGLCRATVMSRIPSLKKCLDLVVPNGGNFGVESSHIEQSTLANRFFDALQPSINCLQA
jgi:hypothetical protein